MPTLPPWAQELVTGYESGAANQFLLHGNVHDHLPVPAKDGGTGIGDLAAFKADFGRGSLQRPCTNQDTCNGDFSCDGDADGTDAALFKSDFGRSTFSNPCPACVAGECAPTDRVTS